MSKTVVVREICFWKRVQSMEKFSYRHWRHQKQIWRPEKVPWCFLKCVVYDNELEFQKPESVISKKWFAILFLKTCPDQKVFSPVAPSKTNMTTWKSTMMFFEMRSLRRRTWISKTWKCDFEKVIRDFVFENVSGPKSFLTGSAIKKKYDVLKKYRGVLWNT